MKTLIYLCLVTFLILSGCAKNDDELSVNTDASQLKAVPENGTISYFYTGGYFADLICDEEVIDQLLGNVEWHVRDHYKNGEIVWSFYTASGSLTGGIGEVFTIHESDKLYWSDENWTFHCNLTGDQGSHYILSGHGNLATWEVFVDRANCPSQ